MMRWKVRKSPVGAWWVHDSTCNGRLSMWCHLIGDCINCGTFPRAIAYAYTKATMEKQDYENVKTFKLIR